MSRPWRRGHRPQIFPIWILFFSLVSIDSILSESRKKGKRKSAPITLKSPVGRRGIARRPPALQAKGRAACRREPAPKKPNRRDASALRQDTTKKQRPEAFASGLLRLVSYVFSDVPFWLTPAPAPRRSRRRCHACSSGSGSPPLPGSGLSPPSESSICPQTASAASCPPSG